MMNFLQVHGFTRIKAGLVGSAVGMTVLPILNATQLVETRFTNELVSILLSSIIFAVGFVVIGITASVMKDYVSDSILHSLVPGFFGGLIGIVIGKEIGGLFDGPLSGLIGGFILAFTLSQSKNPFSWIFGYSRCLFMVSRILVGYDSYWLTCYRTVQ